MYFGLGCSQSRSLNKDMGIDTFLCVWEGRAGEKAEQKIMDEYAIAGNLVRPCENISESFHWGTGKLEYHSLASCPRVTPVCVSPLILGREHPQVEKQDCQAG